MFPVFPTHLLILSSEESAMIKMEAEINKYYLGNGNFLSKREFQCLKYLVLGNSAKQIGTIIGISAKTVEFHTQSVKNKFNVFSKSDLIKQAFSEFGSLLFG